MLRLGVALKAKSFVGDDCETDVARFERERADEPSGRNFAKRRHFRGDEADFVRSGFRRRRDVVNAERAVEFPSAVDSLDFLTVDVNVVNFGSFDDKTQVGDLRVRLFETINRLEAGSFRKFALDQLVAELHAVVPRRLRKTVLSPKPSVGAVKILVFNRFSLRFQR